MSMQLRSPHVAYVGCLEKLGAKCTLFHSDEGHVHVAIGNEKRGGRGGGKNGERN